MPVLEPPTPVSESSCDLGATSHLELHFKLNDKLTRMVVCRQDAPWRAIRAFQNSGGQALVHLHNVSGGILSGDALELSIVAAADTSVQVTSVGATRIYRHRPERCIARLSTSVRVEAGALVEYLPDAIIPFAGSRFQQTTTISLGRNAGFIGWETIAAGRIASGEEFQFDSFQSECSIRSEVRPLAMERYCLTPATREARSVARWGRFRYSTTLYICHTGVSQSRWIEVETHLNEMAMARSGHEARWGASTLAAGGLVVRGLALEAHQITTGLFSFWDQAKQEVWGMPAIAPRKIN